MHSALSALLLLLAFFFFAILLATRGRKIGYASFDLVHAADLGQAVCKCSMLTYKYQRYVLVQ